MKLSQTWIAMVLAILVATSSGCGVINRIRAKNELNEAARTYREGHFEEAEQHAKRGLYMDPDKKTAAIFVPRAINKQYKPAVVNPRTVAKARKAIQAYNGLFPRNPNTNTAS